MGHRDEGEMIHVAERMIVAPATGVFEPIDGGGPHDGTTIAAGDTVGRVRCGADLVDVTSPFSGLARGFLALAEERVRRHQPILWLRVA
jgi:hypothetical protein